MRQPCVFTTTAARAKQDTSANAAPVLNYDILAEWAAFKNGQQSRNSDELFPDIVKLLETKYTPKEEHPTLFDAVDYVANGRAALFLNSVDWNFAAKGVEALRRELLAKLVVLEMGNKARAGVVAERLVAAIWSAAASKDVGARTLNAAGFETLRKQVGTVFLSSRNWDRMAAFTSWASFDADHYNISLFNDTERAVYCVAVTVCFRPDHTEALLNRVFAESEVDPVVSPRAREKISAGSRVDAAWEDPTVMVRLLDAVRRTHIVVYLRSSPGTPTAKDIRETANFRRRRLDRVLVDVAADEAVVRLDDGLRTVPRPAHITVAGLAARAMCRWETQGDPRGAQVLRWMRPHIKLFRDEAGKYHDVDSPLWAKLTS